MPNVLVDVMSSNDTLHNIHVLFHHVLDNLILHHASMQAVDSPALNAYTLSIKGIVSVYIAKFSNGSRKGIPNKQSSAWVSHLVTSGSSEYSIATKHIQ